MGIKVIFFDAGGTLFRPFPSVGEVYAATAQRHGVRVEAEEIEKAFHAHWHQRNGLSALAGQTSEKIERDWWYHLVRDVFQNLQAFPDFDAFFEELYDLFARAECWRLFEDTIPTLETLKSAGLRLGIISNWDHRLFSIVDQLKLSEYFEHVIASSKVGVAKPGVGIFLHALKVFQIEPGEALHIGDSYIDDFQGAGRAGLRAVLLERRGKPYNNAVQIESLRQLPALLS